MATIKQCKKKVLHFGFMDFNEGCFVVAMASKSTLGEKYPFSFLSYGCQMEKFYAHCPKNLINK